MNYGSYDPRRITRTPYDFKKCHEDSEALVFRFCFDELRYTSKNQETRENWEDFVHTSPEAAFYHTRKSKKIIEESFGFMPAC